MHARLNRGLLRNKILDLLHNIFSSETHDENYMFCLLLT
jgi:hypothetical protein